MTKHVSITEAQKQLPELVAAAARGEDVIVGGLPPVRLVPITATTLEQAVTAGDAMTPQEIEERGAKRLAGLGMYRHLRRGPVPDVRSLKPTDDELDAREREKFGDPR